MGLENPIPTGARQRIFKPLGGKVSRIPVSLHTPSRFGPRHCGQSSARTATVKIKATSSTAASLALANLTINDCPIENLRCSKEHVASPGGIEFTIGKCMTDIPYHDKVRRSPRSGSLL